MMMKRKGLSVAVSVALAAGSLVVSQGAAAMAINAGDTVSGKVITSNDYDIYGGKSFENTFDGGSDPSVINTGESIDLSGESFRNLYINSYQEIFTGTAHDNTYSRGTTVTLRDVNSHANNNRFISGSVMRGRHGTSEGNVFQEDSSQQLQGATSLGDKFYNNSHQDIVNSGSLSSEAQFNDYSYLNMTANGRVDQATFSDQSSFAASSGNIMNTVLNNLASGTLTGGELTNVTFNDQSGLLMSSGLADATTFNGQSHFDVTGGEIKNTTLNGSSNGFLGGQGIATGTTTVNNSATLHVVANPDDSVDDFARAETVVLNGGTLETDAPSTNSSGTLSASVGHLTVNNGTVRFGDSSPVNGHFTGLTVGTMDGTGGTLAFNASLAAGTGNVLTAGTIGPGHYNLLVNDATDSKAVSLNTLVGASRLDLIRVTTPGGNKATFDLTDINGKKINTLDLGDILGEIKLEDTGDAVVINPVINKTTRSADAVLGALSSGLFISDGELQNVRSRRGELQNGSQDAGGVWGRYLNDNTHVRAAGTAGYRLEQNGMELGGDKIFDVGNDRLAVGLFGSYSKNKLKQDRGSNSNVDSWGTGVYATWFGAQGYYVDGVVKYNHFSTTVNSRTETGRNVTGDFDQNGLGASLETGYRFNLPASVFIEPYVRAAYFTADGKDVTLSNGLEAKAERLQSIRGETGVSAGKRFDLSNGMSISPYATVAVEHEFDRDNNVRLNDARNYNNDFSGTTGRYGLGVTSQLTRNASVYAEANYRKGEHVESPLMANAGFRVSF